MRDAAAVIVPIKNYNFCFLFSSLHLSIHFVFVILSILSESTQKTLCVRTTRRECQRIWKQQQKTKKNQREKCMRTKRLMEKYRQEKRYTQNWRWNGSTTAHTQQFKSQNERQFKRHEINNIKITIIFYKNKHERVCCICRRRKRFESNGKVRMKWNVMWTERQRAQQWTLNFT